ncbi:hypothetical protein JHK84_033131 [Glycine max]|nr:hypothetical protein JHK84_033131 [Glycine max]
MSGNKPPPVKPSGREILGIKHVKGMLLYGPPRTGKTLMAGQFGNFLNGKEQKLLERKTTVGQNFKVSAKSMIGLHESTKCAQIIKVFEYSYKSPLSVIILDDIERLLEYVPIGPRFSNLISQTLLVLLKRFPPKGKNSWFYVLFYVELFCSYWIVLFYVGFFIACCFLKTIDGHGEATSLSMAKRRL